MPKTNALLLRDDMKRMQRFASRLSINIKELQEAKAREFENCHILSQQELFHCQAFFPLSLPLNVTHLWALFHPSFCCIVHCSKTALMPFSLLYRHFLCAILAPRFVVFSSRPYWRRHTTTKKALAASPLGVGVCPPPRHPRMRMSKCRYSKSSKGPD